MKIINREKLKRIEIKTSEKSSILMLGILLILTIILLNSCSSEVQVKEDLFMGNDNTSLCITNSTNDSVQVFLTLGNIGDTNYVQGTLGIFGIITNEPQGSFWLHAGDTLCYVSPYGKGLDGNITFVAPPVNCADTILFPNGINLFEFALNDNFLEHSQETIDISCVSGVNAFMCVNLIDGGAWNNGTDTITSFHNDSLYKNDGLSGVFPFGCDSCTSITSKTPFCAGHKPYATPQKQNICNIQRPSNTNGGIIILEFKGVY